jgi:hypothetical protein
VRLLHSFDLGFRRSAKPLDDSVAKAWGYASEMARHIREGRKPERKDVELIVGLAATVATYLSR